MRLLRMTSGTSPCPFLHAATHPPDDRRSYDRPQHQHTSAIHIVASEVHKRDTVIGLVQAQLGQLIFEEIPRECFRLREEIHPFTRMFEDLFDNIHIPTLKVEGPLGRNRHCRMVLVRKFIPDETGEDKVVQRAHVPANAQNKGLTANTRIRQLKGLLDRAKVTHDERGTDDDCVPSKASILASIHCHPNASLNEEFLYALIAMNQCHQQLLKLQKELLRPVLPLSIFLEQVSMARAATRPQGQLLPSS
ncbi:hypothetical protein B0T25DRAFT_534944 [Lasiosphaeria hispida]|uniref:Uncharacterized protein n=1 Tax=Lasiosphaeria hispida TaxID=260671 RepID=A0AAJ0MIM2_9PEZI|nr:hypothetical protein B0T25DRAFT_534944 [Lasiosphaeria hispida]